MENGTRLRELYEARRLDEAWSEYERLTQGPCGAEAHLYGALTAQKLGRLGLGRVAIDRACYDGHKGELKAKCLFTSGIIAREAGDLSLAITELTACLETMADLPELSALLKGAALYNKALALQFCIDKKAEAMHAYQESIAEFAVTGMDDYRRQALQNAAWVAADIGEYEAALNLLIEAYPLCTTEHAQWVQRITQAHLDCVQYQWVDAVRVCEWVLKSQDVPADIQSLAASIAAEALLQQGNLSEAESMGSLAVSLASQVTDQRCYSVATSVHTRVKRAIAGAS